MRPPSPVRGARAALARATVAVSALVVAIAGVALPAQAADNPNIRFSAAQLGKVDASGNPVTDGSALTLDSGNDRVRFSVAWALPDGSPLQEGDSFTVTLPPQLVSQQTSAGGLGRPELRVDTNGDGQPDRTVGSCLIELPRFTCTFNQEAVNLVGNGGSFKNFSGNVSLLLLASKATTDEAVDFTFSGTPDTISVDLPGTGGIGAAKPKPSYRFNPSQFGKGSLGIGSSSSDIQFTVGISTSEASSRSFAYLLKQAGKPITFDGSEKTLVFTDTIGSGLKFDDPANWKFSFIDSKATDFDAPDVVLASGNGTPSTTEKGTWTLRVEPEEATADGQRAKVTITGPFEADTNYSLSYKGLPLTPGKLKPGFKYENEITYDDADLTTKYSRSFAAAFSSDVAMNLGYGSFSVTKFVGGPGSALVEQGATFTVNANYALPRTNGIQQTVDSYPGWQAPGTLNEDRFSGKVTLTAKVGEKITFVGPSAPVTFPAGTRITFSEVSNPAAAPAGYAWESFSFTTKDQPVTEVAIGSAQVTPIDLTNRLVKQATGKFSLTKTVEGLAAGATAPADFTFHYTCTDTARTTGDLRVPADGSVVESPEIAEGAECTISEAVAGADVAGYRLTPAPAQTVTIQAGQTVAATATNVYAPTTGRFTLTKKVVNDDGATVPGEFTFTVACDGETPETVTLAADGSWTSKDLAEGTSCTVTEDTAAAQVEGHTLVADIATSPVTIAAGQTGAVVATNTYTRNPVGTFEVVKTATGAPGVETKDYTFNYTCGAEEGSLVVKGDGKPVEVGRTFPVGTECTLTEDAASAAIPGHDLTAPDAQTVTIAEDPAQVTFVNTYAKDLVSVGDRVWYDDNRNGLQDPGEQSAAEIRVVLKDADGAVVAETTTDTEGIYTFRDLTPGKEYVLEFTRPVNTAWTRQDAGTTGEENVDSDVDAAGVVRFTAPATGENRVGADQADVPTLDAGLVRLVSVGDRVWYDTNRDGLQDEGETPAKDVKVTLVDADGRTVAVTATDDDGHYSFGGLQAGAAYKLLFEAPTGAMWTVKDAGSDTANAKDSDVTPDPVRTNHGSIEFTAPSQGRNEIGADRADDPSLDGGLLKYNLTLAKTLTTTATVHPGDEVTFQLVPRNEGPVNALPGWSVVDLPPAALKVTALSGEGYACELATLTCTSDAVLGAGEVGKPITVTARVADGFVASARNVAYIVPVASDTLPESNVLVRPVANPDDPENLGIDTTATDTDNDADADITTEALISIGDFVWLDANSDGQQDADEVGVAGVKVTLLDAKGDVVATTVTNSEGYYWFNNLRPGLEYRLRFDKPQGFEWTKRDVGRDTADSDVDATGLVSFTAPLRGTNQGGALVADDPTLDAGLVKIEPPVPPTPPVEPSPTPTVQPTPPVEPSPTPPVQPTPPVTPAPTVEPTPTASPVPPTPTASPIDPGKPVEPGKPGKPVPPPTRPGLPKTGR